MHQFNNDVSVVTHISIADLQQLQSQNNVQVGVVAQVGEQNLKIRDANKTLTASWFYKMPLTRKHVTASPVVG